MAVKLFWRVAIDAAEKKFMGVLVNTLHERVCEAVFEGER